MRATNRELARSARELDRLNATAMAVHASALDATLTDPAAGGARRRGIDTLLSRRVFTVGGLTVATAAVVAACSKAATGPTPINGAAGSTTSTPDRTITDAVLLRTASSLEHNVIAVYDTVGGKLGGENAAVAKAFADHHRAHAQAMEKATTEVGGEAYTKPNPVVADGIVNPALNALSAPADLLAFAHALESLAAHTYQLMVAGLSVPKLRAAAMSIGAVEARHAAVLAKAMGGGAVAGLDKLRPPASTTTAAKDAVVAPAVFQVPGSFESVAATGVVMPVAGKPTLVNYEALGPNSYVYAGA